MIFSKKKWESKHDVPDYAELAKQLVLLSDSTNPNRLRIYRTSFLKGLVSGVGGVIGATVVIALLVYVLSFFNSVPGVGPIVRNLNNTIQTNQ